MKRCRDCQQDKPLEEFSPSAKNKDGRVSYCRPCLAVRHRAYRDAKAGGPPRRRSAARATGSDVKWCPRCREELPRESFGRNRANADGLTAYCAPCHNAVVQEQVVRTHGSTRDYHLKRRYGLTSAEVDELVAGQGGVCAVCRTRAPRHVDHDHLTGEVRGVLCSGCNQGLGNFRDSADDLRLAADYVEQRTWQRKRVEPGVHRLVPPRVRVGPARPPADLGPLLARVRG